MFTAEEITAWSIDELVTEIQVLLPPEVVLDETSQDGYFVARLVNKANSAIVCVEESFDRKLALLNIFGILWAKSEVRKETPWQRRRDFPRSSQSVTLGLGVPDPGDLDPDEVLSLHKR